MRDNEEKQRYVEYFQRQLVREGSEDFLNGQKHWFESNRLLIAEKFLALNRKDGSAPKKWADAVIAHEDSGEHDFCFSHQIFEPLLAKTLEICSKAGFSPQLPVRFANSPAVNNQRGQHRILF